MAEGKQKKDAKKKIPTEIELVAEQRKKLESQGTTLIIDRTNPNGIESIHINDVLVSHVKGEVFITFSQVDPFATMTEDELIGSTRAEAIARSKVVMSVSMAKGLSRAIAKHLDKLELAE